MVCVILSVTMEIVCNQESVTAQKDGQDQTVQQVSLS